MADDFETLAEDPEVLTEEVDAEDDPTEGDDDFASIDADVPRETPAAAAPAEPWKEHIQEGETPERAVERLARERQSSEGRATKHYHELKEASKALEAQRGELEAARKLYEQWSAAFQQRAAADLQDQLPDPELEPEKATLAEVRSLKEQLAAREQQEAEEKKTQAQREAERQEAERLAALDQASMQDVVSALGLVEGATKDDEFESYYRASEIQRWEWIATVDPNATVEQRQEALATLRIIDARKARNQGVSIVDLVKREGRVTFGSRELAEQYAAQMGAANGVTQPAAAPGTPTPAEISRAAKKATAANGMRRSAGGGGTKPPLDLAAFSKLSEHEQARFISSGEKGEKMEAELWNDLGEDNYGRA